MGGGVVIQIRGPEQLATLRKVLESAATDLDRRLVAHGMVTAKAVTGATQESARRTLPRRGGLGRRVAAAKVTTKRYKAPRAGGVKVIATSEDSLRLIDRKGVIRHPVFGNRDVWVTQKVPAHWHTRPSEAVGAKVGARELIKAVDEVVGRINRA
jgi:hypothetical protein